jgi:leader peptidase (prepilin peptidase) / N-methyltransferase
VVVLAGAGLGLVVGALLPSLIAALPDREPEPSERARTPYAVLATAPRLRLVLAVVTATTWAVLVAARGWNPDLPAYLAVGALGVALAYVDLREHRLPDPLVAAALAAGGGLLAAAAVLTGSWAAYGRGWLVAAVMFLFYLGLAMVRPADLGMGDVKLAGVIGLMLGWLGWPSAVLGAFLGFLFGGLAGLALLLLGRAGRRTPIPFGPFMLLGAIVAIAAGGPVLDAYLGR